MLTRQTSNILYHLLPIVFWLLAGGVCIYCAFFSQTFVLSRTAYFAHLILYILILSILVHVRRRDTSIEACFQIGFLLSIAAYWLPPVIVLLVPIWIYFIVIQSFSFRAFLSSLIGVAVVALYAFIAVRCNWISNPWHYLWSGQYAFRWAEWLPLIALIVAWIASTIARRNLHAR